ncbi:MAG TPA: RIP metalloprotease RseP, partial [Bacillota bacterium]|nr:RIP metalloprotease RseP [Bacillota bacterium]
MITVIYAVAMFCVLIFMHELGHFIAARACNVKVNKFAIGMGPAFWKKQKGETEYSLRIFPIGGYCLMEGEDEDSDEPRALNNKKAWQKAIVICAGSFMNLLLAVILMIIFVFYIGTATTTLDTVQKDSPAEEAGLKPGDKIVMVDGKKTNEWTDVTDIITGTEKNKAE